jgi:hypothetical protein
LVRNVTLCRDVGDRGVLEKASVLMVCVQEKARRGTEMGQNQLDREHMESVSWSVCLRNSYVREEMGKRQEQQNQIVVQTVSH